jgi:hypothetical protein
MEQRFIERNPADGTDAAGFLLVGRTPRLNAAALS